MADALKAFANKAGFDAYATTHSRDAHRHLEQAKAESRPVRVAVVDWQLYHSAGKQDVSAITRDPLLKAYLPAASDEEAYKYACNLPDDLPAHIKEAFKKRLQYVTLPFDDGLEQARMMLDNHPKLRVIMISAGDVKRSPKFQQLRKKYPRRLAQYDLDKYVMAPEGPLAQLFLKAEQLEKQRKQ